MFYRYNTAPTVIVDDVARKRTLNMHFLGAMVSNLLPIIQGALQNNRNRQRIQTTNEQLPNFCEGNLIPVAREDLAVGEKLSFR